MLLKIGSVGEEVKKLQTKLGLKPDGSFGPVTEAKVKVWQAQNNLSADGIVGDISWGIMFPEIFHPGAAIIQPGNFKLGNLRGSVPDSVIEQIPGTATRFKITNLLRLAHFLAQCSHESNGFTVASENLNYSAKRLREIFFKYILKTKIGLL